MDWFIEVQHWLYGGIGEGLKANPDLNALPAFLAASFLFGMVHALMPGHGKSVLVSYHLGRQSRLAEGVVTGALLSVTHVGIAVIFVSLGVAVISRSLAVAGRAPAFETVSALLVVLVGAFLLYRALRPASHKHEGDGKALAISTGLVPCPLTTFILTYAFAHKQLAMGFAAVAAMLGGVMVTIVSFALLAVVLRERLLDLLKNSEGLREMIAYWLELAGAIGVLLLGLLMLQRAVAWL